MDIAHGVLTIFTTWHLYGLAVIGYGSITLNQMALNTGALAPAIATSMAFGVLWTVLTILTGVSYLSGGVDEIKGAFQRVDQVVLGAWLVLLGVAATSPRDDPPGGQVAAETGR